MEGDDLHGEVSFAIGGAAPYGSAHAGRVFRVDPVHIERDVVASGTAAGHAEGFFHDGAQAALIDVAHGEDFHSGAADGFFFMGVYIADADQHAIFRMHLRRKVKDVAQFSGTETHDGGERHAVDVAAGRGLRRIHVTVSIDPYQSNFLVLPAIKLGDPGNGAGSKGVIAAEEQGNGARLEAFENQFRALGTGRGNFLQILGVGGAFLLLLRDCDRDVAAILDDVADSLETSFESGDTDSRRTHVDASARLPEVEWDADDANLLWRDAAERCVWCWRHEVSSFRFPVSSSSQKPLTAKIAKTNPRRAGRKAKSYGYSRCNVLGNGIVSRTSSRPQIQATALSIPMPKPPWGTLPNLRKSRYHLKASSGRPCS